MISNYRFLRYFNWRTHSSRRPTKKSQSTDRLNIQNVLVHKEFNYLIAGWSIRLRHEEIYVSFPPRSEVGPEVIPAILSCGNRDSFYCILGDSFGNLSSLQSYYMLTKYKSVAESTMSYISSIRHTKTSVKTFKNKCVIASTISKTLFH